MTINTPADWWRLCDETWPEILDIFSRVGADLNSQIFPHRMGEEPEIHSFPMAVYLDRLRRERQH